MNKPKKKIKNLIPANTGNFNAKSYIEDLKQAEHTIIQERLGKPSPSPQPPEEQIQTDSLDTPEINKQTTTDTTPANQVDKPIVKPKVKEVKPVEVKPLPEIVEQLFANYNEIQQDEQTTKASITNADKNYLKQVATASNEIFKTKKITSFSLLHYIIKEFRENQKEAVDKILKLYEKELKS